MKTKHTGGAWMAKDGQIYGEATGITFALIPHFDEDHEEQVANAKLMAAAPDLFKSLKYAVNFFNKSPHLTSDQKPIGLPKWERLIADIEE